MGIEAGGSNPQKTDRATWSHDKVTDWGEPRSDLDECSPKTHACSLIVALLQVLKVSEWILDHTVCF